MALISMASAFLFLYIFTIDKPVPPYYSWFVGCRTFIQGLGNIVIIEAVHKLLPGATTTAKKIIYAVAGYLFAFLFFFCTAPLELYLSMQHNGPNTLAARLPPVLLQGALTNSLVILIHNLVILRHQKNNADNENSRLREANMESAYLLLKQQVHPHFLFNALSMMKSLYKEDVRAGEKYLTHLVSFLRASQTESHSKIAGLKEEIQLCNDYLEMQRIRFDKALICTIHIPDNILQQGAVPAFSIQSLIENAIKHNEVTELSPLVIKVFYEQGRIITENNLQIRNNLVTPNGKGLMNLTERYKILSNDDVIINRKKALFSVSIKVLPHEDYYYRG